MPALLAPFGASVFPFLIQLVASILIAKHFHTLFSVV
jgi:hypothetical protein